MGTRRNIYITDEEYQRIDEMHRGTGFSKSILIRMAIDFYYYEKFLVDLKKKQKRIRNSR